jgi:hypothetical protein
MISIKFPFNLVRKLDFDPDLEITVKSDPDPEFSDTLVVDLDLLGTETSHRSGSAQK